MSLQSSQNTAPHGVLDIGTHPIGKANGSVLSRARSPYSERLKYPSQGLRENAAYLDKQVSGQVGGRSSEESLSGLSEIDQIEGEGRGNGYSVRDRSAEQQLSWRGRLQAFWIRNKGVLMVLLAELFSSFMITATRLLETEGGSSQGGMEPFQILLVRMGITALLSMIYMWWTKMPEAPFGAKGIRHLLVIRGLMGFFGVFGLYYSIIYLPLAEATVITFISPLLTCWACSYILHEPFTRTEQIAAGVSIFGVFLIARPTAIFSSPDPGAPAPSSQDPASSVSPAQRLIAVGVALVGVVGAAGAYTTIKWIGQRAHPLISVNLYALWCVVVSTLLLATVPGIDFRLPGSVREWTLLISLGVFGFLMQFLLTAGLAYEKSSRATTMVYSQMVFALAADKLVWGTTPGAWSLAGSALIMSSTIYVAIRNASPKVKAQASDPRGEEEAGLVAGMESSYDDAETSGNGLEGSLDVQSIPLQAMEEQN